MEKLEQITEYTCVHKIKVMKQLTCNEQEEKYRVCNDYSSCISYRPIKSSQMPFKRGMLAIYNFWYQNVSIRGLPTED
jgi:hypothetical protein